VKMGDLKVFLLLNGLVASGLGLAHLVRLGGASPRPIRRLTHFLAGFWPLLWGFFHAQTWALLTIGLWAVVLTAFAALPKFSRSLMSPFTFEGAWLWGSVSYVWTMFLATLLLWERRGIAAASLLAMAAGDPLAEAVGERWGRRHFTIPWCSQRTYEGTAAGFLGCCGGVLLGLWALGEPIRPLQVAAAGLAGALAEAFAPACLDNLTMTAVVALVLWSLGGGG